MFPILLRRIVSSTVLIISVLALQILQMQLTPQSVCKTATGNGATRPIDFQELAAPLLEKRKEIEELASRSWDRI